ncbi:MAG: AI-2E family transporter [Rikenellaceae bacterium]|nr:AI-2E family transporter [Rikenellaceae bacterium]
MTQLSKYIIGFLLTAIILFVVWYFMDIVVYILVAAVIAIIGKPLVKLLTGVRIRRLQTPRWLAAIVALTAIWMAVVIFFMLFVPLVFSKLNEFSALEFPKIAEVLKEPLDTAQEWLRRMFAVQTDDFSLQESLIRQITPFLDIEAINRFLSSIVSTIGHTLVAVFSISFIAFFFLKDDKLFSRMVISLFPARYEQNITRALDSVTELLIRYFTGIIAESLLIMMAASIALLCWGMDARNAFFIGLIMGILNVIPYIGPIIGYGLSIFIGIIAPIDGTTVGQTAAIILFTLLGIKCIDDFVLQPVLYSNRVRAHPLEIFIVILIAGSLGGIIGMLLAIPGYTVLRVFAKEFFYNFRLVQQLTQKI